jgi:hypothetical protein
LRQQQPSLSSAEVSNRLTQLADEFSSVASAVNSLPASAAAREMANILKSAADAENRALSDLSSSLQTAEPAPDGTPEATPPAETPEPTPSGTPGPASTPSSEENSGSPDSAALFTAMDSRVEQSNATRQRVEEDLEGILSSSPSNNATDIANFRQQYDLLVRDWNAFHQAYDEWRRTEGGCDRTQVIDRLGQFSVRFGELSGRVQDLPTASFVRPMADVLMEASQREEEALRVLRNTWRPFTTETYQALEQERANAERLRRQAEIGVQELLERFDIPASEV